MRERPLEGFQTPPNDFEAEQAILSSILFDKEALNVAYETLKGEDFYRPNHNVIFTSMIELFDNSVPVDLITLKNKLDEKNVTEQVGGTAYLTELTVGFSTSANIKHYVKIVKEKSMLRQLIKAALEISTLSYEGQNQVDYILEEAEKKVFSISQNRDSEEFAHIKEVLIESIQKIENIFSNKLKITGVPTGFADLDIRTTGLQPSDFILIAARPSMGKTAFALNIAQNAALRENIPVAIFSLEMSKDQLVNRLLSSEAMINAQKLRTGNLESDDWNKIARAMGPLSEAPIFIDDTPGISVMDLRTKCRKLKLKENIGLVIIDYLQLMSGSGKGGESRQQEISEISRSLKSIARELDVPVIALSQLSRACEARTDHRPMLSDLRDSGAIEQDADIAMFIYRDEYYHPDTDRKNVAEIIIAKQRNGPTGTIDLAWLSQYTKFTNLLNENYQ